MCVEEEYQPLIVITLPGWSVSYSENEGWIWRMAELLASGKRSNPVWMLPKDEHHAAE